MQLLNHDFVISQIHSTIHSMYVVLPGFLHKIRQPLCFMCSKNCTPADNLPLCRSHNAKEQMERDHCPQMWTKQLKQRRRTESVSKAVLNQQLYIHMYLKVEKSMQLQNCSCAGAKYCTQKNLVHCRQGGTF